MRSQRFIAAAVLAATVAACTRTTPPEAVRTEIVEELPPTVCELHAHADIFDDGHEVPAMGTLHLSGDTVTLGDFRCPTIHVVLTKRTSAPVTFSSIGDGVLVRLYGTYHRASDELDVSSIEPFEKGGQ